MADQRKARCAYCSKEEISTPTLGFFENQTEGTYSAGLCATCSYALAAHENSRAITATGKCTQYAPRGDVGFDRFYCGCRGWD